MQISPESMHKDVATIYEQQKAIGYTSEFIEGEADCMTYMKGLFGDWQARGITSVLHEKKGGYANNTAAMYGLATKAEAEGVRIMTGVEIKGFETGANGGAVTALETDKGRIACDYVVVGAGPWANTIWNMLELPKHISIKGANGEMHDDVAMWKFWCLEEGTLGVDPDMHKTNDGLAPPVIHVDSNAPLYSDEDGSLITDEMWGIYYKPDFNFGGIQGGAAPYVVDTAPDDLSIDPYGPESQTLLSVIISSICGVRRWRIVKSVLKGR
jgi:hypothetical protein